MNVTMVSKVLLVLIVHSCVTAILIPTPKAPYLTPLYEAGIEILMSCYGDSRRTVGILNDSDGSVLRALRSKHLIPVLLTNNTRTVYDLDYNVSRSHSLEFFVIASDSPWTFRDSLFDLRSSIWWNSYANFLILDTTPDADRQCSSARVYMYVATVLHAVLNVQFICFHRARGILVYTANPFTDYAPKTWTFSSKTILKIFPPFYTYERIYRKGGENCTDLNFSKTINIGKYELAFRVQNPGMLKKLMIACNKIKPPFTTPQAMRVYLICTEHSSFISDVIRALNATAKIIGLHTADTIYIKLLPSFLSDSLLTSEATLDHIAVSYFPGDLFAVTQYTAHKSQLEKVLGVIDGKSRIGVCLVYLLTFLFFKFFLRQAIVPAILELVRLTCNTGLAKLPKNVAPTIYLACLFAFVVTLQGIFTGNLASLLTTTIAYPNVNTKQDIVNLDYTPYTYEYIHVKLASDSNFHVVKLPNAEVTRHGCLKYVLSDPLAACVVDTKQALHAVMKWKLHISRDSIVSDYRIYRVGSRNPLRRRLKALMLSWFENGLRRNDERFKTLMLQFVDDDEVKKNMVRRIMNMSDLMFAFRILFMGLLCALICFISELVIFRIQLKMAKRRERAGARLAWGPTEKKLFSSLNCRFNVRGLFSKRR